MSTKDESGSHPNKINVFAFVKGEYHPVFGKEFYIDGKGNDQLMMKFRSNEYLRSCRIVSENDDSPAPESDPNHLIDLCGHIFYNYKKPPKITKW
jgi:hypothetical protein